MANRSPEWDRTSLRRGARQVPGATARAAGIGTTQRPESRPEFLLDTPPEGAARWKISTLLARCRARSARRRIFCLSVRMFRGFSQRRPAPFVASALLFGTVAASPGLAQELPLQRDYPGTGPFECPVPSAVGPPSDDALTRAGQLTSDALQAVILGDLEVARTLLAQATEADATSAELAYRHGRVLEDLDFAQDAIFEYCRAIALGAEEAGIYDTRARLDAVYEIVRDRISERAREAFVSGLALTDSALYAGAVESFSVAIEETPEWASAIYNRAIVLEALGRIRESLADYRRYLQLTPSDIDPVVAAVTERVGMLEGSMSLPTPSPGGALTLGVLFPGLGQYYTGRGIGGTLVLSAAAGAVATGMLVKEIQIRCLTSVGADGLCPPEQIVSEATRRPYLLPSLGAAAAVTIVGAVEAFVKARRRRAEVDAVAGQAEARGPRLSGPTVTAGRGRPGAIDLHLLGLRFR